MFFILMSKFDVYTEIPKLLSLDLMATHVTLLDGEFDGSIFCAFSPAKQNQYQYI